ncbi:MAG TPA: hypothetical protein VII42_03610, partial [Caulobacteraceae bacterium]
MQGINRNSIAPARTAALALAGASLAALGAPVARAADQPAPMANAAAPASGEIVVTARKHEE